MTHINSSLVFRRKMRAALSEQRNFPPCFFLFVADLCAILGNFLDNALEAAKQVTEPEQRLQLVQILHCLRIFPTGKKPAQYSDVVMKVMEQLCIDGICLAKPDAQGGGLRRMPE